MCVCVIILFRLLIHYHVSLCLTHLKKKKLDMLYLISLSNDWVDDILVCLYKGKREKGICDNYYRLALSWMQLARFFQESCRIDCFGTSILQSFQNDRFGKEQLTYFRPSRCRRNTLSNIFLCIRFLLNWVKFLIQLTDALWMILEKIGCQLIFMNMLKQMHRCMKSCWLADEILIDKRVSERGVLLEFRTTRRIFDLRIFKFRDFSHSD